MKLESSLLIIPPKSVQAFAYPLREEYDPRSFDRVPAHITLFYPFTPPEQADEVAEAIGKICEKHPPFDLSLNQYLRTDDAIYLVPDDPAPLVQLYQTLALAYPEFVRRKDGQQVPFHPHLTLARLSSPKDRIELPPAPSFRFSVEKLHLYVGSKDEETPYIPRATIPLGGAA